MCSYLLGPLYELANYRRRDRCTVYSHWPCSAKCRISVTVHVLAVHLNIGFEYITSATGNLTSNPVHWIERSAWIIILTDRWHISEKNGTPILAFNLHENKAVPYKNLANTWQHGVGRGRVIEISWCGISYAIIACNMGLHLTHKYAETNEVYVFSIMIWELYACYIMTFQYDVHILSSVATDMWKCFQPIQTHKSMVYLIQ